ncbi:esterase-like activity of phytase family protein [Aureimonas sp. N4]|uniref:esterase-like activity of phytase family protein n=1 Tax=Aureimonas sp. N4 TaxID=1638165 RepID=UPI0007802F1F|nr:esterase-like activity of phytase family protein [Aureimonas sp. N4]
MPTRLAISLALLASTALPAFAEPVFNRVAAFPVAANLPKETAGEVPTSAEIVTASEDGMTLVYSDSPHGGIGFIDITDAHAPKPAGYLKLDGEPTSVAVARGNVLVALNTSESKANPGGRLVAVDLAGHAIGAACDLGGQPDSVAVSPDRSFAAVAIENERDEKVNDGALPQMPAGYLALVPLKDGTPDCANLRRVDMTGLAAIAPEDPEPEFVDINDQNEVVVSLQENNHIVIVDGASGKIKGHFPAGSVALEGVDAEKDGKLDFTGKIEARPREPDAVKWLKDGRIAAADEGDWKGGTRGFTIFNHDGSVSYESGATLEREVARMGHFPEKRADKKGIEPEGLAKGTFGGQDYLFVLAERGSVVAVYRDTGAAPELMQILPSGISPEGAVTIPARNLLVTANEADLGKDGGARSHVMIYERAEGEKAYPTIVSIDDKAGNPIGFGALSALAAIEGRPNQFWSVSDSVYGKMPRIYMIDAATKPARIVSALNVTRDGKPAAKLDLESLTPDGQGGFWLGSEGNPEKEVPHLLLHVDDKGAILEEIAFPEKLLESQTRFGAEGVALANGKVWVAIQRPWKDDPKNETKLLAYDPATKEWGAVLYPLDKPAEVAWNGLSEMTVHGDHAYFIERDNQIGDKAKLKAVTRVPLSELKPAPLGDKLPVVSKETVRDLVPILAEATHGYVVDKVEGLAIDAQGEMTIVTDNDGVDESSGETLFLKIGNVNDKAASLKK